MYGHPAALKRWRAFHRMAKARASRRRDRFHAAQLVLDLGKNPFPPQQENALHLRAFFCLDEHQQRQLFPLPGPYVIPGKSLTVRLDTN